MRFKHYECIVCDAVFKIKHELDPDYYKVSNCVFCGAELVEDQPDQYVDEEEV